MKLSLKLEYACRALAQLGLVYGQGGLVHVEFLADNENIPPNYLVQILNDLRNAGLVISRRGKSGGYALARTPEQISLREIIEVVESELLESRVGGEGVCGESVAKVWRAVANKLTREIDTYTLADMMPSGRVEMYYI
jgi:Rrf2 family transcriptional regulator, cysteine metabolism repressor